MAANERSTADAGMPLCFHFEYQWPGAADSGRCD